MAFKAPNYTQTPNEFFDEWLPKLKLVELRVLMVIFRKTFGWHKIRDRISLDQLVQLTGSQKTDIGKATRSLEKLGLITKEVVGENGSQNTYYELVIDENSNKVYQCEFHTGGGVNFAPTKETITKEIKEKIQKKENATSADASALCSLLHSKIKEKKSNFSKEITPSWGKCFDKLLKNRSKDQIEKVIDFVINDDFWFSKCLNPNKLLTHIDALEIEMTKKPKAKTEVNPEENKQIALKIEKNWPEKFRSGEISIGFDYIEFRFGPHHPGVHIKFADKNFKNLVAECMNQIGITGKNPTN